MCRAQASKNGVFNSLLVLLASLNRGAFWEPRYPVEPLA